MRKLSSWIHGRPHNASVGSRRFEAANFGSGVNAVPRLPFRCLDDHLEVELDSERIFTAERRKICVVVSAVSIWS
jgi:hypothetical protein